MLAAGLIIPLVLIEFALATFSPGPLWQSIYDPVTVHTPKPNSSYYNHGSPSGEPIFVRYNSLGHRDIEHAHTRDGDVVILILGDSFAEAVEVSLEDTFFRLLEASLNRGLPEPRYHVINLGVGGFSTLKEMYRFERHLEYLTPDIVFLLYHENDPAENWFVRNIHVRDRRIVYQHLSLQDSWVYRFFLLSRFSYIVERMDRVYYKIMTKDFSERYHRDPHNRQEAYRKTVEALDAFQFRCEAIGAKPVLVIAPTGRHLSTPEDPIEEYEIARRFARESQLTYLDLTQPIKELQDRGVRASFEPDAHWTPDGHKVVARALFEFISGEQF